MKHIYLLFFAFLPHMLHAHSPDVSSLMFYEQNGEAFLIMKSSLTAFEGEINYHFNKDSYKTPEEFKQLVIKHFIKNSLIMVNDKTLKFIKPQVQLGHETTLFVALGSISNTLKSIYIKNNFFKDMPNNQCELIIRHNFQQKQFILNNENNHQVKFSIENGQWAQAKKGNYGFKTAYIILLITIPLGILALFLFWKKAPKVVPRNFMVKTR